MMNGKSQVKLGVMMFLATVAVLVVHAQTGGDGGSAAPKAGKSLLDLWNVGGPVMWPIGLCSVLGIGLTVYCAIQYRLEKMVRPDIQPTLRKAFGALDFKTASAVCSGAPCMLTTILRAGLIRLESSQDADVASFEKAMEEASVEEVSEWQKPLGHLSLVAQIAPMLGLLGTVTGMIGAFDKIGLGAMGSPEKLAANIGEAMITTAAGLIVAIPSMFTYFYFKAQFTSNVARVSLLLGNLSHHLGMALKCGGLVEESSPAAAPSAPIGRTL
ncbi:MAG: MotA/TolQ/ExbB proton channel family protein [Lentisphaerae bacterium]|nr:MotA/TolQ/ExbB proton channel family protein [Lentisphaerota bacterium]